MHKSVRMAIIGTLIWLGERYKRLKAGAFLC